MLKLDRTLFPQRPADFVSIRCVPVLYKPILGSPEQLVVGVLCASAAGWHLERANRLDRLICLYGKNVDGLLLAIEVGLDTLEAAIQLPEFSVTDFRAGVSGMHLGEMSTTEEASLKAAAMYWLTSNCSLFSAED